MLISQNLNPKSNEIEKRLKSLSSEPRRPRRAPDNAVNVPEGCKEMDIGEVYLRGSGRFQGREVGFGCLVVLDVLGQGWS
eukprot:snap_masked-scaffold_54-processed-gene-1.58-mRNA-1 protein AED:1.00 eAED:1.00 QI:0/0/0/0/1/1/2/0/79